MSVTAEGIDAILQQDSGRSQPTENHREIIRQSIRWFSRLGFHTHVPIQTGENQVCDARANIPINENLSIGELQDALATFEDEYPLAAELSGSNNLNLEAEGTTQRKPARTIENVLRASRKGRDVILVVKDGRTDGHGRDYHANRVENILTNPPYYREKRLVPPGVDPSELKEDEENMEPVRFLYNKAEKLKVGNPDESQDKFALLPKGSQTVWFDTGDKLKLFDGHGQHAKEKGKVKYSETQYASSNAMSVWCRYDNYQKEWVVYPGQNQQFRYESTEKLKEEWQFVYAPLYMENEVSELPDEDDWKVVILPDPDAITRDPNDPAPDPEDLSIEEKYKLDFCFPPEEVPLIYEDGETRPMVGDEYDDLLTEPRIDYEDRENEAEAEGEDATVGVGPTTNAANNTGELTMDSFDQIEMEKEAKDIIEGYRKQLTHEEKKRLQEIDGVFGAKNPAEIEFWREIWDEYNRDYDTGIPESVLPDAIIRPTGLVRKKAKDAVTIGKDFDLLVEDEPKDEIEVDIGDDAVLRLVIPEERPDLYLEDAEEYADKRVWDAVWEFAWAEQDETLNRGELINGAKSKFDLVSQKESEAAVAVAELSGAIERDGDKYYPGPDRPDEFWINVWGAVDQDLSAPLPRKRVLRGISFETTLNRGSVKETFETALEHNELYSPDHVDDGHFVINDPSSDEGPEIIERDSPLIDDSDDDQDQDDQDPDGESTQDGKPDTEADSQEDQSSEKDSDSDSDNSQPDADSDSDDTSEDTSEDIDPEPETPTADDTDDNPESPEEPATTEAAESPAEEPLDQDDQSGVDDENESDEEDNSTEYESSVKEAMDHEDMVDLGDALGDQEAAQELMEEDSEADGESDSSEVDDALTRFLTYEEPNIGDGDEDDFDVDRDAVKQFVDEFAEVGDPEDKHLKVAKSTMKSAFLEWTEINNIELDELSPSLQDSKWKGNLIDVLENLYGIEAARARIDKQPTQVYRPIELSEELDQLREWT